MKKLILILFLPVFVLAQYYGERTTEQNFEKTDLYFNSTYLNTYGLQNLSNISLGFFDDPFLNLYLNPALQPQIDTSQTLIYLDFRGERGEEYYEDSGIYPLAVYDYDSYYYPRLDPRWQSESRIEPEPVFSLGLMTRPMPEILQSLYIAATYQLIHKNEPFYQAPYWIYNQRYLYDSFGNSMELGRDIPVEDIYSGTDEINTESHLFAFYTGFSLTDKLDFGIGVNGVAHTRDGEYGNNYRDNYTQSNEYFWENQNMITRNQEYSHVDVSAGLNYRLSSRMSAGIKAGQLSGTAKQKYMNESAYIYQYNEIGQEPEWSYSLSQSSEKQNWKHDGTTRYLGLNFSRRIDDQKSLNGYYRFSFADIDLSTNSSIIDTSIYSSYWEYDYDSTYYEYEGVGRVTDLRSSSGKRKQYRHEAAVSLNWKLSEKTTVNTGVYLTKEENSISVIEPVDAYRYAYHRYEHSKPVYEDQYFMKLIEDKTLQWKYNSDLWSFQIPVITKFDLNEYFDLMLGVSRIYKSWRIEDETIAYFNKRELSDENGTTLETDFGERYLQPTRRITEDDTDLFAGFGINLSPKFKINLLLDPDFEYDFRIRQWWLSFRAEL